MKVFHIERDWKTVENYEGREENYLRDLESFWRVIKNENTWACGRLGQQFCLFCASSLPLCFIMMDTPKDGDLVFHEWTLKIVLCGFVYVL